MNKFLKDILIFLGGLLAILALFLSLVHNSVTDRINPLIKEETSYAQVPLKTQDY
ncbi:hypothetical protein [Xylocopilactobacillus apicola]|uniref:Uncharacterized protein n=1 Tax=Xylocopilactobacillus apicola TaxID=2932184 RepID=A0AAU9DM86_9LACO|nr:hypothetical protein [Xylocopilactobacillus apicola]BDR58032.1 hypothetical protein XA3_04730 [Xylocopilactobacillus apicola]